MGTDIEKLVDLMIQERMQSQFAKWREAETGTEKKEDCLRLENEYEKAISALSEEQKDAVRHYCDSIFDSGAESECFFYRLGLKDGIRLWKFMKKADENGQLTDVQQHIYSAHKRVESRPTVQIGRLSCYLRFFRLGA